MRYANYGGRITMGWNKYKKYIYDGNMEKDNCKVDPQL